MKPIELHPRLRCQYLWLLLASGLALQPLGLSAQGLKPATRSEPAAAAVPKPTRSYTPKAGESLDSVIANTLADSPLRIELLRLAYIENNPKAFLPGKGAKLRKGVVLSVPDHDQLLRRFLRPTPAPDAEQNPIPNPSTEERRRWVHFP